MTARRDVDPAAVTLRPFELGDWTTVHEWAQRPDVCRYQAWGPNTPEETRDFALAAVAAAAEEPRDRHVLTAVVEDLVVGLTEVTVRSHPDRRAEVGYAVHPECWRRGVGSRIARLAVDHAFGRLGMHRVEATCDVRNAGSVGVLRTIGMTYEGRLRENVLLRDGWRDSEVFGVLAQEWTGDDGAAGGDRP